MDSGEEYDPGEARVRIKENYKTKLEEKIPEDPDPLPRKGFGRRARLLLLRIRAQATMDLARIASWCKGQTHDLCNKCDKGLKHNMAHILWDCPALEQTRVKHRPQNIATLEGWTHPPGQEQDKRRVLQSLLDLSGL